MAIIRDGSLTVVTGGVAQNLVLGFIPTRFTMWNLTLTQNPPVAGIVEATWFPQMANGTALITTSTVTTGALALSLLATNGVTPFVTPDSQLYPVSNLVVTGISQAAQAVVTATNSFTAKDDGVTVVTFHNIVGMTQINTLSGVVQSHTGSNFVVNINTTGFSAFATSPNGIANIITGIPALQGGLINSGNAPGFPPAQTNTFQVLNAPLYNAGVIGLTLGSGLMVNTSNVWAYEAVLDADFTSA